GGGGGGGVGSPGVRPCTCAGGDGGVVVGGCAVTDDEGAGVGRTGWVAVTGTIRPGTEPDRPGRWTTELLGFARPRFVCAVVSGGGGGVRAGVGAGSDGAGTSACRAGFDGTSSDAAIPVPARASSATAASANRFRGRAGARGAL